jgi:hypothetical protein
MQTRSGLMAPDAVAPSPGTAGSARHPGFGYGGQAAVIRQEALNQAAAIRQAAKQDAAAIRQEAIAIREPAVREAARLQAVILSLSEQLSQMSAYIAQNLVKSGGLTTMPAPTEPAPAIAPPRPRTRPGAPAARTAAPPRPGTRPGAPPARPGSRPGAPPARPAGPGATPAGKPQGRPRQFQAMRVATAATAALFLFAVVSAGVEIATFGFKFFVFRTAVGESGPGVPTDQQFLAQEAATAHEAADKAGAAKPAAHKPHTPGRHSAKTTKTTDSEPAQQPKANQIKG